MCLIIIDCTVHKQKMRMPAVGLLQVGDGGGEHGSQCVTVTVKGSAVGPPGSDVQGKHCTQSIEGRSR